MKSWGTEINRVLVSNSKRIRATPVVHSETFLQSGIFGSHDDADSCKNRRDWSPLRNLTSMHSSQFFLLLGIGFTFLPSLGAVPAVTVKGGGELIVKSTLTVNGADILVETGAIMRIETGSTVNADTLEIEEFGQVLGCGTVNAALVNNGTIIAECGSSPGLELTGTVANSGEIVLKNGTRLTATAATFTNTGALDLRHGDNTLPSTLVNVGGKVLLTGTKDTLCEVTQFTINGDDIDVHSYTSLAYEYHLEFSDDLKLWADATTPVVPGGGTIIFTHTMGSVGEDKRFYRVVEECR